MSTSGTRSSKRKGKTATDSNDTSPVASSSLAAATAGPARSTPSILTSGLSSSTSASIPSSLHQSAFSAIRASSPHSSSHSLAPSLPSLPLAAVQSPFASAPALSLAAVPPFDNKEQTDDESDSPDSNALDDAAQLQRPAKKLRSESGAAADNGGSAASSGPSSSPTSTGKKQPEPELSDAAKHVLFERRWSPEFSTDWSSSSALSLHLSWQKLIDLLQQQFGVRWTKKKLADAADHAKKVYVDRRKAAKLPGHRTPQPWKWHTLMDQWLGPQMTDIKDEDASSSTAPPLLPPLPVTATTEAKPPSRGPPPPLAAAGSASAAAGGGGSLAMDGALNHALYALVQDSQRRQEEEARAQSDKLDRLLAVMQTIVDRLPARAE